MPRAARRFSSQRMPQGTLNPVAFSKARKRGSRGGVGCRPAAALRTGLTLPDPCLDAILRTSSRRTDHIHRSRQRIKRQTKPPSHFGRQHAADHALLAQAPHSGRDGDLGATVLPWGRAASAGRARQPRAFGPPCSRGLGRAQRLPLHVRACSTHQHACLACACSWRTTRETRTRPAGALTGISWCRARPACPPPACPRRQSAAAGVPAACGHRSAR